LGRRGGALDSKKREAREMAIREAYIRSMDSDPFIYSCNGESTYAALGVRTPHTVYPGTNRGPGPAPQLT
jgi:hypothetical protein